jgi:quercetin dioxygenase-like cupin family protein
MKKLTSISVALFVGLLLTINAGLYAQDPLKVAPNVAKKVLLENDHVRVYISEFAAGETATWHSHPNHVVYALNDGKLEITEKGKPASVVVFKTGEALYFPAVTHMVKNIGTTTIKMVVIELKAGK